MSDPVTKAVEVKDLEVILSRMLELAQDLEVEVNANYPSDNPTSVRRRNNDTETARWAQSAIPAFAIKYEIPLE